MKKAFQFLLLIITIVSFTQCDSRTNSKASITENNTMVDVDSISQEVVVVDTIAVNTNAISENKKINKKNLVIKEWNTNVITNTKFLDHVTTYNSAGQKIEEIEYNMEGQKWRERYEYDSNGNKTRELLYDGVNKLVSVKKYEYNEFGKKRITYTYNANGRLIAIKNYEYIAQ